MSFLFWACGWVAFWSWWSLYVVCARPTLWRSQGICQKWHFWALQLWWTDRILGRKRRIWPSRLFPCGQGLPQLYWMPRKGRWGIRRPKGKWSLYSSASMHILLLHGCMYCYMPTIQYCGHTQQMHVSLEVLLNSHLQMLFWNSLIFPKLYATTIVSYLWFIQKNCVLRIVGDYSWYIHSLQLFLNDNLAPFLLICINYSWKRVIHPWFDSTLCSRACEFPHYKRNCAKVDAFIQKWFSIMCTPVLFPKHAATSVSNTIFSFHALP